MSRRPEGEMRLVKLLPFAVAALAGACATPFVYRPGGPAAGGPRAPVRLAVVPLADGTGDFVERIVPGKERRWNLARKGFVDKIGALPPALWSRALADELAASGRFRAVRFAYGAADLGDADYVVGGRLLEAYGPPGEWAMELEASRPGDGRVVWRRRVARTFERWDMSELHPRLNQAMREMFDEAGADLARALGDRPADGDGRGVPAEPVQRTIERILEGK